MGKHKTKNKIIKFFGLKVMQDNVSQLVRASTDNKSCVEPGIRGKQSYRLIRMFDQKVIGIIFFFYFCR